VEFITVPEIPGHRPVHFEADFFRACRTHKEGCDILFVGPCFCRNIDQHGGVPDLPAFGEVSTEKRFNRCVLRAFFSGQPDEPVGFKGVGGSGYKIVAKRNASLAPRSLTCASSACKCSHDPNFCERYTRRSMPSYGMSGLSWNGFHLIRKRSSGPTSFNASAGRRFAT
jgi:hypothetical protein